MYVYIRLLQAADAGDILCLTYILCHIIIHTMSHHHTYYDHHAGDILCLTYTHTYTLMHIRICIYTYVCMYTYERVRLRTLATFFA